MHLSMLGNSALFLHGCLLFLSGIETVFMHAPFCWNRVNICAYLFWEYKVMF